MNKRSWFCKSCGSYQESLYNLFVVKKQISIEIIIKCLHIYADTYVNKNYKRNWLLDHVNYNFDNFLQIVSKETGVTFKKRPLSNRRKKQLYNSYNSYHDGSYDGTIESVHPHWKD